MTLERRRDRRYVLERPVKLQCDQTGTRYLAGRLVNISAGGAMLVIDHPQHLRMGQSVRLSIAGAVRQALMMDDEAVAGTLIRCLGCSASQHVAIRFHKPHLIAEAG